MSLLDGAEIAGSMSGLLGAWLLAARGRHANFGWWAYLASNCCWLAFSLLLSRQWLLAQTIGFTASSAVGIWNYWAVERYPSLRPIEFSFRRGLTRPAPMIANKVQRLAAEICQITKGLDPTRGNYQQEIHAALMRNERMRNLARST